VTKVNLLVEEDINPAEIPNSQTEATCTAVIAQINSAKSPPPWRAGLANRAKISFAATEGCVRGCVKKAASAPVGPQALILPRSPRPKKCGQGEPV